MRRSILAVLTAIGAAAILSGCAFLFPFVPQPPPVPQTPQSPSGQTTQAPAGWSDLEPCDTSDRWVWVESFPVEQFETAGLEPECGGTYFDPDLPTYTSVGDSSVTDSQLDALRAELEALGFVETASTFEHPEPGGEPGLVGSWQYERNEGDPAAAEAIFIVNYWYGSDPVVYTTYFDYESPSTRELQL